MKIVHFNSGLGNQIFQYMFCQYLRKNGANVYGYYNKRWLKQHNGLEIHKVFDCCLPPDNLKSRLVSFLCRCLHRFDTAGRFFSSDFNYNPNSIYYSGYWQDRRFFSMIKKPNYRNFVLCKQNAEMRYLMINCNSVSVHIRRGDYLNSKVMKNLCDTDYYKRAIALIDSQIDNPVYFVFSDDIAWAKEQIQATKVYFIDWNNGSNSYLDMYLMSQCKAHVIANSSFSFWGALLAEKNSLTVYPSLWFNGKKTPDIAPDDWVKI